MDQVGCASACSGVTRGQLRPITAPERPAARGDDQPAHRRAGLSPAPARPGGPQALGEGRVLGVDRQELPGPRQPLHQRATDDQRLLVGERQRPPLAQRGERGGQAERAGDAVEHHVARPGRGLGHALRARQELHRPPGERLAQRGHRRRVGHRDHLGAELGHLPGEQLGPSATGGEGDDAEPVRVPGDDVQRLGADRSRRAEQGDGSGLVCSLVAAGQPPGPAAFPRIPRPHSFRDARKVANAGQAIAGASGINAMSPTCGACRAQFVSITVLTGSKKAVSTDHYLPENRDTRSRRYECTGSPVVLPYSACSR